MYIPKHCPECGEHRSGFIETTPEHLECQMCGMEFKIELTYDVDAKTQGTVIEKSCENCGTKERHGCSWHTAEDCGNSHHMWTTKD